MHHYQQGLKVRALTKLVTHKDEQQLFSVALAFRKQNILEKWRVFVARCKAQMVLVEKRII